MHGVWVLVLTEQALGEDSDGDYCGCSRSEYSHRPKEWE